MINDPIQMTGNVSITLTGPDGKVKARRAIKNLVVQTGKDLAAANFAGTSADTVTHIGVGTDATAPVSTQTALLTPLTPRVSATQVVAANPSKITYTTTFGAGVATGSIAEAGLFTALSAGTMVARTTFTAIPKAAGDSLVVNWDLNFG